ncbi:MAG: hypothetical protein WC756_17605 [Taibaiella sp.]|jgi:hypothetical protein
MQKKTLYKEHEILLTVTLNSGSKIVGEANVLTHTLDCRVDNEPLFSKTDLTDTELIAEIAAGTTQAERRIDLIGSPEDSPIVVQLLQMGFTFEAV